jgi:hypothetical protein
MRESLEIIAEIRGFILNQNPMRFPHQKTNLVNLLNELEATLSPVEETVVEEPTVEVIEEVVVEETVVEEPTVEVVAPKTTTRKK